MEESVLCAMGITAEEKFKHQKNGNVYRYVYYAAPKRKVAVRNHISAKSRYWTKRQNLMTSRSKRPPPKNLRLEPANAKQKSGSIRPSTLGAAARAIFTKSDASFIRAAGLGIEPKSSLSESDVLPLHHPAMILSIVPKS